MSQISRSGMIVAVSLLAAACGRKGALVYPDMLLPAPPASASIQQSGSAVKLQFMLPDKDRGGRTIHGLSGVRVSRRTTESGQKEVCRLCTADYTNFQTIYLDHLQTNTQRFGNRLILLDGDVKGGKSYSYGVSSFTADGLEGAILTTSEVRVVEPISAPVLTVESFPTEVKLNITPSSYNSGILSGFNIYRSPATGSKSFQPLNKEVLKGNEFIDSTLERGIKYRYSVRALVSFSTGEIAESTESNEVEGALMEEE